jgi:hypothetical protein
MNKIKQVWHQLSRWQKNTLKLGVVIDLGLLVMVAGIEVGLW